MLEKYPWLKVETIRGLIVAAIPLIVAIGALFGFDSAELTKLLEGWSAKGLLILSLAGVFYATWKRSFEATPPITDVAVQKTMDKIEEQKASKAAATAKERQRPPAGGQGSPPLSALIGALLIGFAVIGSLSIQGCTETTRALRNADAPADYALVFLHGYKAALKTANSWRDSGRLQGENLQRVQALEVKAYRFVEPIEPLQRAYESTRSTQDFAALQDAVDDAAVAVADFVRAVQQLEEGDGK